MFPELAALLEELGEVEAVLAASSVEGRLSPAELAALTARLRALGQAAQPVATSERLHDADHAAAFRDFTARFKACAVSCQTLAPSPAPQPDASPEKTRKVRKFRMRGYLKKRGQKYLMKWRRRYFKRDGDRLYYFIDQDDLKPRGSIDLLRMTGVELVHEGTESALPNAAPSGEPHAPETTRFRLTSGERTFELEADTPQLAQLWVKSLQEWKMRASTMSRPDDTHGGDGRALVIEYEHYEQQMQGNVTTENEKELLEYELEARRLEKKRREDARRKERLQREEERRLREEQERVRTVSKSMDNAPLFNLSAPTVTPITTAPEEPISQTPENIVEHGPEDWIKVERSEPIKVVESPAKSRTEQLREQLSVLSETHSKLSAHLVELQLERQMYRDASEEALFARDFQLRSLKIEKSELDHELQLLRAAREWGFQRVRAQSQHQSTTLAYHERTLASQVAQLTHKIMQLKHEEETLRHQIETQNHRIAMLKEAWETANDAELKGSASQIWQQRLEREQQALQAHSVQHELLTFEVQRATDTLEAVREESENKSHKLMLSLIRARRNVQSLRLRSVSPAMEPHTSLPTEIDALKQAYFQSLALAVKLSLSQHHDGAAPSIVLSSLWDRICEENVHWSRWPQWLTRCLAPATTTRFRAPSSILRFAQEKAKAVQELTTSQNVVETNLAPQSLRKEVQPELSTNNTIFAREKEKERPATPERQVPPDSSRKPKKARIVAIE